MTLSENLINEIINVNEPLDINLNIKDIEILIDESILNLKYDELYKRFNFLYLDKTYNINVTKLDSHLLINNLKIKKIIDKRS